MLSNKNSSKTCGKKVLTAVAVNKVPGWREEATTAPTANITPGKQQEATTARKVNKVQFEKSLLNNLNHP
tara:strand:+ start:138 stop:347 length:210 start_codon:yes stop_codon:yes gene_type:complete